MLELNSRPPRVHLSHFASTLKTNHLKSLYAELPHPEIAAHVMTTAKKTLAEVTLHDLAAALVDPTMIAPTQKAHFLASV